MVWLKSTIIFFGVVVVSVLGKEIRGEWMDVEIAQGPVRGRRHANAELYEFYNIPYATAPVNEDKFKAPLSPPTWTEPYLALDRGIMCPQTDLASLKQRKSIGQEQCLITNIFVPDTPNKNLSVVVYVHGGGFQLGMGNGFKTTNLMKHKDLIVVTFNYRLGIPGFLCLGTEDVPGNAGMKDQVALLRWVQQNIAAFGGNPNDVTLAGFSAGSVAVDLLMISKSTDGLFNKVIPESGVNLAVLSVQSDPLQIAKDHAKTLNFTNVDDIYALERFYKNLPYDILMADPFVDKKDSTFSFVPCIERDTGDGAFLTKSPLSIIKSGDYKILPLLYGFANMEGLIRIVLFDEWKSLMNETFSDFLPADLKFETEDEKEEVAKSIRQFYFNDKPVDNNSVLAYVDYFSDVMFNYPALRAIKLYVESGHDQIYLYEYSFVDEDTPVVPYTNVRGADHCAQTAAIGDHENEDELTPEYRKMKKIMRKLWRNFMKTGKPVPEGSCLTLWPAVRAYRAPHMDLGRKVKLGGILHENRTLFWENIYEKHYREPIPPPAPQVV